MPERLSGSCCFYSFYYMFYRSQVSILLSFLCIGFGLLALNTSCSDSHPHKLFLCGQNLDTVPYPCLIIFPDNPEQIADTVFLQQGQEEQTISFSDSVRTAYLVAGNYDAAFMIDFKGRSKVEININPRYPILSYLSEKSGGGGYERFVKQNTTFLQRYSDALTSSTDPRIHATYRDSLISHIASFVGHHHNRAGSEDNYWIASLLPHPGEWVRLRQSIERNGGNPNLLAPSKMQPAFPYCSLCSITIAPKAWEQNAYGKRDTIRWEAEKYRKGTITVLDQIHHEHLREKIGGFPSANRDSVSFILSLAHEPPSDWIDSLPAHTYLLGGEYLQRLELAKMLKVSELPAVGAFKIDSSNKSISIPNGFVPQRQGSKE